MAHSFPVFLMTLILDRYKLELIRSVACNCRASCTYLVQLLYQVLLVSSTWSCDVAKDSGSVGQWPEVGHTYMKLKYTEWIIHLDLCVLSPVASVCLQSTSRKTWTNNIHKYKEWFVNCEEPTCSCERTGKECITLVG